MEENFDYIIAGGGLAGVAMACELRQKKPSAQILILEKEAYAGGRVRSADYKSNQAATPDEKVNIHGYGLAGVSESLVETFQKYTDQEVSTQSQTRLGVIAAGRVQELPLQDIMSADGFRAIGGAAASKEWKKILSESWEELEGTPDKSFLTLWKGKPKKSAGAIVLQHYARMLGIADTWNASMQAIKNRAQHYAAGLQLADWGALLTDLLQSEQITFLEDCRIGRAEKSEDGLWSLRTEQGTFSTKTLVVAQSPWQALDWLPKPYWPADVLAITSKTTPVSVVTLTAQITSAVPEELCDVHVIPAEEVQIVKGIGKELCFQATIDYEISLHSANVAKSIKKLKRARRKFLEAYPEVSLQGEYIALVPVGWAQSPHFEARGYLDKLDMKVHNRADLLFCGDAYGSSYDFDDNLTESVNSAAETLAAGAP